MKPVSKRKKKKHSNNNKMKTIRSNQQIHFYYQILHHHLQNNCKCSLMNIHWKHDARKKTNNPFRNF